MDSFRYSNLADRMRPSPIRELFKVIAQPGMISFAGGLPDPQAFPVDLFASCADVLSRDGRQVLQYGASEGYGPLREKCIRIATFPSVTVDQTRDLMRAILGDG